MRKVMGWKFAALGLLAASGPAQAQSSGDDGQDKTAPRKIIPITSTTVLVKRHLRSIDGNILLDIYTGGWESHGLLHINNERFVSSFQGYQKGSRLTLKSFDAERGLEAAPLISFNGNLDLASGRFVARWEDHRTNTVRQIQFWPDKDIADRPTFTFKFYGYKDDAQHREYITRIDVIDRKTKKVVQQLRGIKSENPNNILYEDINFDGYFDLRMRQGEFSTDLDEAYYYWLYDPHKKRFIRSAAYETMLGSLDTSFWCRELRFHKPRYAEVEADGSITPKASGFCRPWDG